VYDVSVAVFDIKGTENGGDYEIWTFFYFSSNFNVFNYLYGLLMDLKTNYHYYFNLKKGLKGPKLWNFTYLEDI
jgi:hypothetical protein